MTYYTFVLDLDLVIITRHVHVGTSIYILGAYMCTHNTNIKDVNQPNDHQVIEVPIHLGEAKNSGDWMQMLRPAAKNRMMLCTEIGCCFQNRFSAYSLSIQDVTSNTFRQPKSEIYTLTPLEGSGSTALTLSINEPSYFDYEVPEYREHIFEVQISRNSSIYLYETKATPQLVKAISW